MTTATATAVEQAFGKDNIITLEDGSKVRIRKWSVRKAMVMGATLSRVIGEVFGLIDAKSVDGEIKVADVVAAIPKVLESCADELTYIIVESTTLGDGKQQITKEQVLDDMSLDDFVDLLSATIEMNLSDKTMGKWKRLLRATPLMGNP
jgi:mannose/fructose/N-acetylgalactosamine-specific phosphotransferase system component IIB